MEVCNLLREGREAEGRIGIVFPTWGCTTLPVHIWWSPTT